MRESEPIMTIRQCLTLVGADVLLPIWKLLIPYQPGTTYEDIQKYSSGS